MSNGFCFKKTALENRELLNAAMAREAALREELAALRESYEAMRDRKNSIVYLQQRLTSAEQRACELKRLLCDVINEAHTGFAALKVDLAHRVNDALKPADHPQCEECKGWGYHENHHEGGGTECGECGGSGNATVAVALDTSALLGLLVSEISVDDRGFYHLSGIHPNNFKRALEASGAKLTSEVKSNKSPVAVAITDEQILEAMRPAITYADGGYVFDTAKQDVLAAGRALLEVARLNGVKP